MKNEKQIRAQIERRYKKALAEIAAGVKAGKVTEHDAERRRRWLSKERREDRAMLNDAANAGGVVWLRIEIEWHKSRTWGNCPRAEVECSDGQSVYRSTGYASGCGYDKESAAVCEAVAKCAPLSRLLIENAGRIRRNPADVSGVSKCGALPRWSFSGAGMSTFLNSFRPCWNYAKRADVPAFFRGFRIEENHTRLTDSYYLERRARRVK